MDKLEWRKGLFWGVFGLISVVLLPYRFDDATEAELRPNSACFTMQFRLRCRVKQPPLHPKRICERFLILYTFGGVFISL